MRNFISEDDIEQAILSKLKAEPFEYDILICDADPSKRDDLNDGTGRNSKKECVLPDVMLSSLKRINPTIEEDKIKEIVKTLRQDYTGTDIVDTNYKLYRQIRNNIKITVRRNGKEDFDFVKLIDFEHPKNNTFTAVSQMWIQGRVYYRRPDILIFVNGMPLVFIELKNSIVKVEEAYNKNLKDYMRDIPNLFAFNQICVLSNGLETKLGALMQPTTISLNGSRLTVKKKNWTEKQFLQQIMSRIAPSDILLTVFLTKIDSLIIQKTSFSLKIRESRLSQRTTSTQVLTI